MEGKQILTIDPDFIMTSFGFRTIDKYTHLVVGGYINDPQELMNKKFQAYVVKHTDFSDLSKLTILTEHNLQYPAPATIYGDLQGSRF